MYILHINRLCNLRSADKNGKSDPYIKYRKGNEPWLKTHVEKKTLDPRYENADYTLTVTEEDKGTLLQFEVWDKDTIGKDFLGLAELAVDDVVSMYDGFSEVYEISIDLGKRANKPKDKAEGSLILTLTVQDLERYLPIANIPETNWTIYRRRLEKTAYGDVLYDQYNDVEEEAKKNIVKPSDGISYYSLVPKYFLQLINNLMTDADKIKGIEITTDMYDNHWEAICTILQQCDNLETLYLVNTVAKIDIEKLKTMLDLMPNLKMLSTTLSLEQFNLAMARLSKLETLCIDFYSVRSDDFASVVDTIVKHDTLRHLYLLHGDKLLPWFSDLMNGLDTLVLRKDKVVLDDPTLLEGSHTVTRFKGKVSTAFAAKMVSLNTVEHVNFYFDDPDMNVDELLSALGNNSSIRSLALRTSKKVGDVFSTQLALDTIFSMDLDYLYINYMDHDAVHEKFCSTHKIYPSS